MRFDEFARKAATDMQLKTRHAPIPPLEERRSRPATGLVVAAVAASLIGAIWVSTLVFDTGPEVVSPPAPVTPTETTVDQTSSTDQTVADAAVDAALAHEAIAAYLEGLGISYLGSCGQAPAGAVGYCSIDNGDGTFGVGAPNSEIDATLTVAQDEDGSWKVISAESTEASQEVPDPPTASTMAATPSDVLVIRPDGLTGPGGSLAIQPAVAFAFADGGVVYQERGDAPIMYRPAGSLGPTEVVPSTADALPRLMASGVIDGSPSALYILRSPAVIESIETHLETLFVVDLAGGTSQEVAVVAGYESGATTVSFGSGLIAVGQVGEGMSNVLIMGIDGQPIDLPVAAGLSCGMECLDQPRISPDGQTLAYLRLANEATEVVVIDLASGDKSTLASLESGSIWMITDFDGRRVAVAAVAFDEQGEPSGWGAGQIVDAGGVTPLPDSTKATFIR